MPEDVESLVGSAQELLKMPYSRRRIIAVADNVPGAAAPSQDASTPRTLSSALRIFRSDPALAPVVLAATAIALIDARRKMQRGGEDLLLVSSAAADQLRFPVGHPRKNVAYIGHPVDPPVYIPVADFHRFIFEHKVAEALRVIRSLGAVTIEVSRVEGWDQSIGVNLGATIPATDPVEVNASASQQHSKNRTVLSTMRLSPGQPPMLPPDLVWLPHEPLWQEIARARLESGLDSFVLDVRAADDYGVNAGLKALVARVGLEAGGSYIEHRDTIWRLQGTFISVSSENNS